MGVTVFHSLTATTPDNTQYEIKPSNWNSNHVVSLSLQGSDISNAFTNSPSVTFGSSGAYVTASVNTNYAATNITTNAIALSNSSLFQQTSATSAITSAAFASANSSLLIAASNSSLFQQTSATSAITSNAFAVSQSSLLIATSNSSLFQQTSATSAITSAAFPSAQTTKFAGTGTTFSGTNVSGSMTLNSNGLNLALSAGAGGGGNFSAGISTGGNTSGTTGTVSNQIVFVGGNNVTLSGSTGAGGATVTISGANIGGAQTGISGIIAGTQTQTSGTVSFANSNGITFGMSNSSVITASHNGLTSQSNQAFSASGGSSTFQTLNFANSNGVTFSNSGGSIVASYTVPTVPTAYVSSVNGSSGAISLNVGSSLSASTNGSSITFGLASNITTALQSAGAYLTTQSAQAFSASGGSSTFQTLNFANSNGVTFSNSGGSVIASVPGTSSISATGIVSISTNGNTISIGAPAMSIGVSGGNTSGNTGTVSNQFVLAGGNNITLSGSTNAAGMTVTVSANTAAAANLSVSAGTTSGAFGGLTFANSNNVTFGLNNGTITASAPSGGGGGIAAAAGSQTQTSGTVLFSNSNGITFGMSNSSVITASHNGLTSQSNQAFSASGGSSTFQTLNFANSNGVTFSNSGGSIVASYTVPTVPTAYVSSVNGSSGAISLNVGSSLSASTNGSSITFGLASNITTALQSAGAYLTTAAQSSASNVSLVIAGTASNGGTASLSGGVSFSNANGVSFFTSAGNAIVATVKTDYLTSQSNQAFSASGGSSTFQTLNFANSNGVTFSNSGGSVVASVPGTSSISATGAVSISTTGSTISIGAPAFSVGVTTLGNTSGNTGTVSNQLVLAGGNNITLSGSTGAGGMTLTISGPNVGGAQTGISGIIAGTQTQTAGTVSFANSNGITFGMSNSSVITASYTVPTVPTAYVSSINGSSGAISLNVGSSLSASTNGSSITFGLASNITTALQSAGAYLTTQSAQAFSASGGSSAFQTLNFANSNGVTFSNSGGSIVASYTVPTVPTAYVSSVNGSSGAISLNVGSSLSASTNGSSITFGLASNITTALQSAGAYLTTAAQSSASNVSLVIAGTASNGGTASLSGGVSFSNANGVSFFTSAGNAIVATVKTDYLTTAMQSQSSSVFAKTGFTSASTAGTAIVATHDTNGLSMGIPAFITAAAGAQTAISGLVVSNTTYTSGTVSFRDGNGITFASGTGQGLSITHGLQFTSATSAITSNALNTSQSSLFFQTSASSVFLQTSQSSLFQHTSATSAITSAAFPSAQTTKFAGTGTTFSGTNVSGSITLNSNGLNLALSAGAGGGGGVVFANSQTTYTSGTVSLREGGGAITIASNTGQRIDISVPAVSSIYGTNGILISSSGSSISIQNDYNKTWEVAPALSGVAVISTLSSGTLAFMPLYPQDNYTFSGVQMLGSFAVASNTRSSYAASHTISYALYSVNQTATTMSQLGSSSLAILVTASSNARGAYTISYDSANSVTSSSLGTGLFSALSGQKLMNFLFASSLMDGGAYALGIGYSSTTPNAADPLSAISFNQIRYLSNISAFGVLDGTSAAATANSYLPDGVPFVYSATSGGWPSTIGFSQRRQLPTYQFPYVMFRGT